MHDPVHWWLTTFRDFFAAIDKAIYSLISFMYQIFFNIANATLISGEVIKQFFGRVQLILGIIVLFKLAISLIAGIVNPDSMKDNKNGISKIVTRVLTALVMLVLIVPLNIPTESIEAGSYEAQLNNHGILFGTLYDFQSRILSQNTMARLILGQNLSVSNQSTDGDIAESGKKLSSIILKSFVKPNLAEEEALQTETDPLESSNRLCQDDNSGEDVESYLATTNPRAILAMVSFTCSSGDSADNQESYIFDYSYFLSTACGILILLIMIGFTLDMSIRAFKLAILRLIAPIPIISYISPKSENNGTFGSWVKAVSTTYLDLFIRVAILYFIIFIIDAFQTYGIVIDVSSGAVGGWSWVFIIIGLFFFAKEAPKFITESLGIKSNGGFFKSVGRMLGIGAAGLGIAGAAATNFRAAREEQTALHPGTGLNRARRFFGIAGSTVAGVLGGTTALARGALNAKDGQSTFSSAFQSLKTRNALRAAHSTVPGRIIDNASSLFTGASLSARDEAKLKVNKEAFDQMKALKPLIEDEAKKHGDYGILNGLSGTYIDENGNMQTYNEPMRFNYEQLVAAMNAKDEQGYFTYRMGGQDLKLNVSDFDSNTMNDLLESQSIRYQEGHVKANKTAYADNGKIKSQLQKAVYSAKQAGIQVKVGVDANGNDIMGDFTGQYKTIGPAIGQANQAMADMEASMEHIMRRANSQANKNK